MDLLQKYLLEMLLDESLDVTYEREFEKKFSREDFDVLIKLDPTYDESRNRIGQYGRWLLNNAHKGNIKPEDYVAATEVLDDFNSRKRYIREPEKRDINKYKNLDELRDELDNIELTDNQKNKLIRKSRKLSMDEIEGLTLLGYDDTWEVWEIDNYEASCNIGKGTEWCTARVSSRGQTYFDDYVNLSNSGRVNDDDASHGKLVVFVNSNDSAKRYQAQVIFNTDNKAKRVNMFMDIYDRSVDFFSFINEQNLRPVLEKTYLKDLMELRVFEIIDIMKKSGDMIIDDRNLYSAYTRTRPNDTLKLATTDGDNVVSFDLYKKQFTSIFRSKTADDIGGIGSGQVKIKHLTVKLTTKDVNLRSALTETEITDTITIDGSGGDFTIEEFTFRGLGIKKIDLRGVTFIGNGAFSNCKYLEEVIIPDTVKQVGVGIISGSPKAKLTGSNKMFKKLMVPRTDAPQLKDRLNILEESLTEALIDEALHPSVPRWFGVSKQTSYGNIVEIRARMLKLIGYLGDDEDDDHSRVLAIDKMEMVKLDKDTLTGRSPYLREPYLPIYYFAGSNKENLSTGRIYIPGVNDDEFSRLMYSSNYSTYGSHSKIRLIRNADEIYYIDLSNPDNFTIVDERRANRPDPRFQRASSKEQQDRSQYGKTYDKSGYIIDYNRLNNLVAQYVAQNHKDVLKREVERLNKLRATLMDQLKKINLRRDLRDDIDLVNTSFMRLFDIIRAFKGFENAVAAVSKDRKIKVEDKKVKILSLVNREFFTIRQAINKLERNVKQIDVIPLL